MSAVLSEYCLGSDIGVKVRPDWEKVVTPVVDYLLTRRDVDSARIALYGGSFGGYLAPRAAAFEHRLAACIADAALFDPAAKYQDVPARHRQRPGEK